jgi:hypothetical protein
LFVLGYVFVLVFSGMGCWWVVGGVGRGAGEEVVDFDKKSFLWINFERKCGGWIGGA